MNIETWLNFYTVEIGFVRARVTLRGDKIIAQGEFESFTPQELKSNFVPQTRGQRQWKRRIALNRKAIAAGWPSWSAYETAALHGQISVAQNETYYTNNHLSSL